MSTIFVYLKEKQLKDKVTFLILNSGIREGLNPSCRPGGLQAMLWVCSPN